jgi:hypothetical protein
MATYNNTQKTKTARKASNQPKATSQKIVRKQIKTVPGRTTGFSPTGLKRKDEMNPMHRIKEKRKTVILNGQLLSRESGDPSFLINRGTAILKRKGYAKFPQVVGDRLAAKNFLFHIGCTISHESADFSLANPTYDPNVDTEDIQNANILDIPAFQKITNQNILATDKFSFINDPFFRLDGTRYGGIPDNTLEERRKLIEQAEDNNGLLEVAAAYASINTNGKDRSFVLKDFKKITHLI